MMLNCLNVTLFAALLLLGVFPCAHARPPSLRVTGPAQNKINPAQLQLDATDVLTATDCSNATMGCRMADDHSNHAYCIVDPCSDCENQRFGPNGTSTYCPTCFLWDKQRPTNCQKFYYSPEHLTNKTNEWKILPCKAVKGIEAVLGDSLLARDTNFLWRQAWEDATAAHGANGRHHINESELGLVINSFWYRSQHQMHIHAAELNSNFTSGCLKTLKPQPNRWVSPQPSNCDYNMLSKHTPNLDDVNEMIREGANQLNVTSRTNKNRYIGAAVSQGPNTKDFWVTVFEGIGTHGDHQILDY